MREYSPRVVDRPPQGANEPFILLSNEEFEALPFDERIEYLRLAVRMRNAINEQIDSTLHQLPADKPRKA